MKLYFLNDRLKITDRLIVRVIIVYTLVALSSTILCIALQVGRVPYDLTATNIYDLHYILYCYRIDS